MHLGITQYQTIIWTIHIPSHIERLDTDLVLILILSFNKPITIPSESSQEPLKVSCIFRDKYSFPKKNLNHHVVPVAL